MQSKIYFSPKTNFLVSFFVCAIFYSFICTMQKQFFPAHPADNAQHIFALEKNLMEMNTWFERSKLCSEVKEEPEFTILNVGNGNCRYNNIFGGNIDQHEAPQKISKILSYFKSQKRACNIWLGPTAQKNKLGLLVMRNHELVPNTTQYGMLAKIDDQHAQSPSVNELLIERVKDHKGLRDFQTLNEIMFGSNVDNSDLREWYDDLKFLPLDHDDAPEFYVAYRNGKPVTSGLLFCHAGIAAIRYICTMPDERRKGYAREMMQHLLHRAHKKGYAVAGLEATPQGKPLYEKLGFKECCTFHIYYMPPAF